VCVCVCVCLLCVGDLQGQEISLSADAVKGTGKIHAKWSPVATASYRLLPKLTLRKPVTGKLAEELVRKCPMKVFDIEDLGSEKVARVARPRNCSMCRECIREEAWAERVQLQRVKTHFICRWCVCCAIRVVLLAVWVCVCVFFFFFFF
jgi:DNA-directed RNA polymerase alpha subunit